MKLPLLYERLSKIPHASTYYRNQTPPEYLFAQSDRIGPLVVVCDEGYTLSTVPGDRGIPGLHGYNNSLSSMRTVFMGKPYKTR